MQSDIKWEFVDCGNDKGMLEAWKSVTGNQLKVGLFLIYVPRKDLMAINVYKCFYRMLTNINMKKATFKEEYKYEQP